MDSISLVTLLFSLYIWYIYLAAIFLKNGAQLLLQSLSLFPLSFHIQTQNIFLSKNDIIKVGDLGIARVLDGSCDLANTVIGTPYYMSPELFSNQPYDHKSDIWALGCCVYEMATLKHAFTARNINALMYKILQGKVPPLPGKFSTELSQLVQLMMSLKAKDRPSVHQILRMPFVRGHIKMFLDRTASKRK